MKLDIGCGPVKKEGFKAKFRLESFEEGVNDSTVILKCIK
jgi:hypothetical protein